MSLSKVKHQLVACVAVLFCVSSSATGTNSDNQYGCVYIDVRNLNDEPTDGLMMLSVDTLGNGQMFLCESYNECSLKLLPGSYYINTFYVSPASTDWFHVNSGDSLYFQFRLKPIEYIDEDEWPLYEPVLPDTAILHLPDSPEDGTAKLSIYPGQEEVRTIQYDHDSYQVIFDTRLPTLLLSFPHLEERVLRIPYQSVFADTVPQMEVSTKPDVTVIPRLSSVSESNPLTISGLTNDEWLSPEYEMKRTLIDPYNWGDSELARYGFIGSRGYFNSDDRWRIVLVFHRKVVVLSEGSEPVVYELDTGMFHPEFSPQGGYVFYCDQTDELDIDEWAVMLNTETGYISNINRENPDEDSIPIHRSTLQFENTLYHWWSHFPASDGSLISVYEDSFRYYAPGLEDSIQAPLPYLFESGSNYRLRSSDGTLLYLIGPSEYQSLFALDLNGLVVFELPIDSWSFDVSETNTLAVLSDTSIRVWNLNNGSMIQNVSNSGFDRGKLSPDGNIIGLSRANEFFEIRNSYSWELIDSYTIPPDSTARTRLTEVANNGTSVLMIQRRSNISRMAIRSPEGDLLWVSPLRISNASYDGKTASTSSGSYPDDYQTISSDGSRFIFNDGCFIQILEFAKWGNEDEE